MVPEKCPVQLVVAPPFVSLERASSVLKNGREKGIELAAQNMSQHPAGAYTAEISARMIKECGCSQVILGHSERRAIFGETDAVINAKVLAALEARLHPILCVGETLEERDGGLIEKVLETQLRGGLAEVGARKMLECVIAYEPVWAIGTGRTASPEQAQEAHAFIRKVLGEMFDVDTAQKIRIQYGWQCEAKQYGRADQPNRCGWSAGRWSEFGEREFLGNLPGGHRLGAGSRIRREQAEGLSVSCA